MGNITTLNLSYNRLKNVQGLDKLYSLENLMIESNDIRTWNNIVSITHLPQLIALFIAGNPVIVEGKSKCSYGVYICV